MRIGERKDTLLGVRARGCGCEALHVQAPVAHATDISGRAGLGEDDVRVVEEAPLGDAFLHRHAPLLYAGLPVPDHELVCRWRRRAVVAVVGTLDDYGAEVVATYVRRVGVQSRLLSLVAQLDARLSLMGERVGLAIRERAEENARFAPFRKYALAREANTDDKGICVCIPLRWARRGTNRNEHEKILRGVEREMGNGKVKCERPAAGLETAQLGREAVHGERTLVARRRYDESV